MIMVQNTIYLHYQKNKWVEEQNKMIPTTKYWIELIKSDISNNVISITNIESTELIKVEPNNQNNQNNQKENYTDYLLL